MIYLIFSVCIFATFCYFQYEILSVLRDIRDKLSSLHDKESD